MRAEKMDYLHDCRHELNVICVSGNKIVHNFQSLHLSE